MNIVKNADKRSYMVNFIPANEYLYGVGWTHRGAEQGGAYQRRIIGVRIEDWPQEDVDDIHFFFKRLQRKEHRDSQATFDLFLGPALNFLRKFVPTPFRWAERGNCARWTSMGLVFGDLLPHRNMWPKALFIHLMERHSHRDPKNVNVVVYEHIRHAYHEVPGGDPLWLEQVQPWAPFFSWAYFDLSLFAKAKVVVEEGSETATVVPLQPRLKPSYWRYKRTEICVGVAASVWGARWAWLRWHQPPTPPSPPPQRVTKIIQLRRLMRAFLLRKG